MALVGMRWAEEIDLEGQEVLDALMDRERKVLYLLLREGREGPSSWFMFDRNDQGEVQSERLPQPPDPEGGHLRRAKCNFAYW